MGNLCEKDDKPVVGNMKSSLVLKEKLEQCNITQQTVDNREEVKKADPPIKDSMIQIILYTETTTSAEEPAVPAVIAKKKTVGLDDFIMLGTLGKV